MLLNFARVSLPHCADAPLKLTCPEIDKLQCFLAHSLCYEIQFTYHGQPVAIVARNRSTVGSKLVLSVSFLKNNEK